MDRNEMEELLGKFANMLIENMNKSIRDLDNRMEKGFLELNKRMDKLEARMDNLEARMDNLEARMDNLEARMDSLESRMDSLEKHSESNGNCISELKIGQTRIERRLLEVSDDVQFFKEKHIEREKEVWRLDKEVRELRQERRA
ncbi:hypothetical protein LSG31_05655 [Fodinisporobacter ferrooxydans]|uniref:t-SNARE coiled-coil homology domain-containing protein n=1 Tax=Fodinisporobacter ferrooxydans TaxID=2901836 RepID=A0ABY4CN09_9BACL|nr:hypothetical protein LSG31_05655 [Alicyclobacillaceae bacterium MYW30-H2]